MFDREPDFPVAQAFCRDALARARASTDPPFDPPPEFCPDHPHPHVRLQCWRTEARFTIDGIQLDPVTVRVLMAQNVMPSLEGRVRSMTCPNCGHSQFDAGEAAYVAGPMYTCSECGRQFPTPGRTRNTVANPLPAILAELAKLAQRPLQEHRLDLLPETL